MPLTIIILLLVLGSLTSSLVPVGLSLSAVLASMGITAAASAIVPMDASVTEVILLIGLAVGVDYCLFYLRREREERAPGADPERALAIAAATSGRAVLISALTVIVATSGMFLTQDTVFASLAVGTILVVAIAALGSLTVLPAVLSKLGDRIDLGRVPGLYRRESNGRGWRTFLGLVLRRPGLSAVLAAAVLLALAVPALRHADRRGGHHRAEESSARRWTRSSRSRPPSPAAATRP